MGNSKSLKEQIINHTVKFSLGTALKGAGGFVNQYFAALLLGPSVFGIWQGVKLILSYGGCVDLGVLGGMHREIPILRGRKDQRKISEVKNVSFIFNFLTTIFLTLSVFLITFVVKLGDKTILSLRFIAFILLIQFFKSFIESWLKANNKFDIISLMTVIEGIGLALSVILIFLFSFLGFLIGYTISIFISVLYGYLKSDLRIDLKWNPKIFKTLVAIGFPIMLIGISAALFHTVDRLLILKFIDTKALGIYSLGSLVFMPITFIFYAASSVMYPRFSERFGKTGNDKDLKNFMILPTKHLALSVPVLIGAILVILPISVRFFLPEYVGGIDPARILVFGLFFESIVGMAGNFFLATNRQFSYLAILLGSILINLVLSLILLKLGLGILGVAIGTSVSYFVFFLAMAIVLIIYCKFSSREILKFFLQILLPLIYIVMISLLVTKFVNIKGETTFDLIKNVLFKEFVFLAFSWYLIYLSFKNLRIKKYKTVL